MSHSLEEKLTHAPKSLILDPPRHGGFKSPDLPGRPEHLRPQPNDGKSPFPSADQLHDEEQRAVLLHFFANHELLAVELMALALLKFPDAPDSFRRGVLRTLQEEQNHTRWYLQRMKECGVNFGDYNLSPMIWSHISDMESPLDYVSRLSLTFEQANLDYAKHYSTVLAQAGDPKTAKILNKIYHDEIAHVGYGVKWLRRWKENAQSDWDAWNKQLHFPLSPIRAKGMAPFNEEGRRKAGLDEDFIAKIKRFQSTRGRSPDLYWFNPDVELVAASPNWTAPKRIDQIAADLEYAFALSAPSEDDIVLLRKTPSDSHRAYLAQHGLSFPEIAPFHELQKVRSERKIRNERPWGQPRPELLSKEFGLKLRALIDPSPIHSTICKNEAELHLFVEAHPKQDWIAKPLLSSAGRGILRFSTPFPGKIPSIKSHYLIEPWLNKALEFSLLYQRNPSDQGGLRFIGLCHQEVSSSGQWISSTSAPKPATQLPSEQARFISNQVLPEAKEQILKALDQLLKENSYTGPVCIDSFLHNTPDGLAWNRVSEINTRWSMGRLAHQLRLKLSPSRSLTLTTLAPAAALAADGFILLGDPKSAHQRVPVARIG
ncbi:DUF455 family protein [Verrucomicrobiaceae bacterium 227]